MEDITVEELKAKIDNKETFKLIDVRETEEFNEYNIGGQLIPLGLVETRILDGTFKEMGDTEIIIHCRSGKRSKMAQHILAQAGITNTKNLTGGVMAWADKYQ